MNNIFQLLENEIKFKWDPEELTKNFKVVSNVNGNVISLPGGAYWQYYTSGIYFTRNFYKSFPEICEEIAHLLIQLQNKYCTLTDSSYLVNLFVNHKINIDNITLIKVVSGKSVDLHFDRTRSFAVNIGLKNSNTCLTHIYSGKKVVGTLINEENVKHTLRMNDGDVYILEVNQPHAVESLSNINDHKDRYLISYSFKTPAGIL